MINAYAAIETPIARTETKYHRDGRPKALVDVYPSPVKKGDAIGQYDNIDALYKHLSLALSVGGPRSVEAMWGDKGYMRVSLYEGEDYTQDSGGRPIRKYCD